ncbi:MAG: prepilin-type N-terminal cleavage/methylation domain-containing protein [Planctomycetota bacterium]|nr:prepilin-type N-terminal cleavage/methylation domain-containing protein [Planctomycetota bacterium]
MRRRQAFTLIELMVVIAIIAALAAVLVPAVAGIVEKARFVKCGANFNTLGKQLKLYDIALTGVFPSIVISGKTDMLPTNGTIIAANSGLSNSTTCDDWTQADTGYKALGGNPMQQIWPLIQSGGVGPTAFHCPADPGWLARVVDKRYGWTKYTEFSYGVQWPFKGTVNGSGATAISNLATPYGKKREDRLVLMADRNPGDKVSFSKQHANHPDIGANGLDAGGNLMQYENPGDSKSGMNNDNIYIDQCSDGRAITGRGADWVPDSTSDTVITPILSRP